MMACAYSNFRGLGLAAALLLTACSGIIGLESGYVEVAPESDMTENPGSAGSGGVPSSGSTSADPSTADTTSGQTSSTGSGTTSPCTNRALSFNGSNTGLHFEDHDDFDGQAALTVEAWVHPGPMVNDEEMHIVAHHDHGDERGFLLLVIDEALVFRVYGENKDVNAGGKGQSELQADQWYHTAGTFDAASGTAQVFLDGQLVGSTSSAPGTLGNCSCALAVGSNPQADKFHFDGVIDEVRLSSVVRYPNDFAVPQMGFETDSSTLALWHFDELDGDELRDESGVHNGTLGAWPAAPARIDAPCIEDF